MVLTSFRLLRLVIIGTLGLAGCGQALPTAAPPGASLQPAGGPAAASSPPAAATVAPVVPATATPPGPSGSPAATPATPAATPAALTVAEVYQRTARALARPGLLYHATSQWEFASGTGAPLRGAFTVEQWVDAGRDVAREKRGMGVLIEETLTTATGRYRRTAGSPSANGQVSRGEPAATCQGTGVAVAAVLGCDGPPPTVEEGRYAGRAAIVLVATARSADSGELPRTITIRHYLDADTFLPLAMEQDTQFPNELVRGRAAYAHDFIPVAAVPAEFFDPVAFGYLSPADLLARPVPGFPDFRPYWLGERFAGAGDLPPLALAQVEQGPDDVGILFTLFYGPAAAPSGHPLVRLQEWPRATWEARPPEARRDPPCTVTEEIALPAGRAAILMRVAPPVPPPPPAASPDPGACPAGPYTSFLARAFFGETMVFVIADGPYNSRAGIELVLRALQPRTAAAAPALPGLPNTGGGAQAVACKRAGSR